MDFLEMYDKQNNDLNKSIKMAIFVFLINLVVLVITNNLFNLIISAILIYTLYLLYKKKREIRDFICGLLPLHLEDDGYYKLVSTEIIKKYTYYFDKNNGDWVLEYPINATEAKIIKLNEFDKFTFFSTLEGYQPVIRLTTYEVKEEILEWFQNHPEISINLMPRRIKGELEFEDIYNS